MAKKTTKSDTLKSALIEAMHSSLGIVSTACKKVGCARSTYYEYYESDNEFKEAIDDVQDVCLDFAESKLFKLIDDEIPAAVFFYMKTKGKKRGYIERQEIDHTTKGDKIKADVSTLSTEELIKRAEATKTISKSKID